jgi:hypothetical protein
VAHGAAGTAGNRLKPILPVLELKPEFMDFSWIAFEFA